MKTRSIEKIFPCYFFDKNNKMVEYSRALVCTTDEKGGVNYTLEKCCKEIDGLDAVGFSTPCNFLYDFYGRICAVTV